MRAPLYFISLFILFILPAAAQAQGEFHLRGGKKIFEMDNNDPTRLLSPEGEFGPQTKEDFANLYYNRCTLSNINPDLNAVNDRQCACTASKMMDFLSLNQMKALYSDTSLGSLQRQKLLLFAYMPCMEQSVEDIVTDACLYNAERIGKMKQEAQVCQCLGRNLSSYVAARGPKILPGFVRSQYRDELTVENPLEHILQTRAFEYQSKYFTPTCMFDPDHGK